MTIRDLRARTTRRRCRPALALTGWRADIAAGREPGPRVIDPSVTRVIGYPGGGK